MKPDSYDIKREIGVVMQDVAVFDELTVYENIDYFCGLYIKDKEKRRKCVEETMDFVDIADYRKFLPKKLSGGLLRRLNIACGIAHKPNLYSSMNRQWRSIRRAVTEYLRGSSV